MAIIVLSHAFVIATTALEKVPERNTFARRADARGPGAKSRQGGCWRAFKGPPGSSDGLAGGRRLQTWGVRGRRRFPHWHLFAIAAAAQPRPSALTGSLLHRRLRHPPSTSVPRAFYHARRKSSAERLALVTPNIVIVLSASRRSAKRIVRLAVGLIKPSPPRGVFQNRGPGRLGGGSSLTRRHCCRRLPEWGRASQRDQIFACTSANEVNPRPASIMRSSEPVPAAKPKI
jgi:hypothetical protein